MTALGATVEHARGVLQTARILDLVAAAERAKPGAPVVIRGEHGVGKDVLARLIHATSPRHAYPFIKVNCAAPCAERCEADLFGAERGSPTATTRPGPGAFEFANHGTIYLDDVRALPSTLASRLLCVLRTGEVSRVGGRDTIPVDVRVIASTLGGAERYDPLWNELKQLEMVEIFVPPLRDQTEEIPAWVSFFLRQLNTRYRQEAQLCPEVVAGFKAYGWPGNIRELKEAVHQLVVAPKLVSSLGPRN